MINKKDLINVLNEYADLLEFQSENSFKVNAFRNGANIIRKIEAELENLIKSKEIEKIKGIGKGIQSIIYDFYENGFSNSLNEIKNEYPESIFDIFKIRGLGPKKISVLYKNLDIKSIGELEYACKENRILLLKGFGELTQQNILLEIEKFKINNRFFLLDRAEKIQNDISKVLDSLYSINKFQLSGELRRNKEIISQIEFVLLISSLEQFTKEIKSKLVVDKIENDLVFLDEFPAVFYLTFNQTDFVNKLFETTGSKEFIYEIGYTVQNAVEQEKDIFSKLNYNYYAPELREAETLSFSKKVKESDLSLEALKGLLHFHSIWSDGSNTISEMVNCAKEKGYIYFFVCDHSKSAIYANGLSEERIIFQNKEIQELSNRLSLNIFQGIESDILKDGSLDYNKEVIKNFGLVVASVHSNFNLSESEMTDRIIKAIENPFTDILGHLTGRLLLARDSYKVDVKKIIDACSRNSVAIEINANPHRLDLDWRYLFYAKEKECKFAINADAHSISDIEFTKYGIMIARKGELLTEDIINCYEIEKFKKYLNRKVTKIN